MREIIIGTLESVASDLRGMQDEFYIIGGSALFLLGVPLARTHDIDLCCSIRDAEYLKLQWMSFLLESPETKDNELFKSDFAQFDFPTMPIEVQGELKVNKSGGWVPLTIREYKEIKLDGIVVKVPTLLEMKRILTFFGREKDFRRIADINQYLAAK